MINFTERLDRASHVAAWAHEQQGQHRKGTDIPYIVHPMGVMILAANVTNDEDVLVSCLLHDVPEDVDSDIYSTEQMAADFGQRVVDIVLEVTKDDDIEDWHERAEAYIAHLRVGSIEALTVCSADKLYNIRAILRDYRSIGDEVWQRFSTKSASDQLWYYGEVHRVLQQRLPQTSLTDELGHAIDELTSLLG